MSNTDVSNPNRPLSPHLQVYRLPMLAVLSICHRASGIVLTLGAFVIPFVLLALASGPDNYAALAQHLTAWYGLILLFLYTLVIAYHMCNGVRHLVWDTGNALDVHAAERSGYIMLAVAAVITISVWLTALIFGGAA